MEADNYEYLVIYEPTATGTWSAYSPDLPGCIAAAETRGEIERLMSEAVRFHVEGLVEDGDPIPAPSSYGTVRIAA